MASSDSRKEDVDLVSRVTHGDAEAEERLFRKYRQRIMLVARRKLPSKEDAEDVCQDTLWVVLEAIRNGKVRNPEALSSYVYRICSNKISDLIKRNKYDHKLVRLEDVDIKDIQEIIMEEPMSEETRNKLNAALDKLASGERRILHLLYVERLSSQRAAHDLGLRPDTVRKKAQRARDKLKKTLSKRSKKVRHSFLNSKTK